MSKELHKPFGLEYDESRELFIPVYFSSYSDLTRTKTGLIQTLKLLTLIQWDHKDESDVRSLFPNVFDSITELLLQLSEPDQENANILDDLHEKIGSEPNILQQIQKMEVQR